MALSTCPKCNSTSFEVKEHEPRNSKFKLNFVQCASCGAVVGARDFYNTGAMLLQQNRAIERIAAALHVAVDLE